MTRPRILSIYLPSMGASIYSLVSPSVRKEQQNQKLLNIQTALPQIQRSRAQLRQLIKNSRSTFWVFNEYKPHPSGLFINNNTAIFTCFSVASMNNIHLIETVIWSMALTPVALMVAPHSLSLNTRSFKERVSISRREP